MEPSPETDLIAASVGGEREAYGQLVRAHSRRVFAVCLGMLGTFEDAEDMAQDTFIRGYRNLSTLRDPSQFGAWITKIARNLCVDFLRRNKRGRELASVTPLASVVEPNNRVDLHDAIARLPEEYRLPLLLYYFDGRSTDSVAQTLGISPAGVLTRLSRARRELRRMLSEVEASDA